MVALFKAAARESGRVPDWKKDKDEKSMYYYKKESKKEETKRRGDKKNSAPRRVAPDVQHGMAVRVHNIHCK